MDTRTTAKFRTYIHVGLYAVLFLLAAAVPVHAAQTTPHTINFQGKLSTAAGGPVADGSYNIKFRLYDSGNAVVFSEDYVYGTSDNRVTVHNGLFSVQLGSLNALSPSLFAAGPDALSIEVELPTPATATCASNGCASFTEGPMSPRQPIGASGYALNADLLDGMDSTAFGDATAANQSAILSRIGTSLDAAGTGSLFARLTRIDDTDLGSSADAASASGSIFARLSDLYNHLGNNDDAASNTATASAHAKLNFLTNLFASGSAVGDTTDSPTGNVFQRLHDIYTRVSGIATSIGNTNDSGGTTTAGTVNAKLNAILGASGGSSGKTMKAQAFTSTGNWTAPSGVYAVNVFLVGGGGSGGGGSTGSNKGGGGGGGGVKVQAVSVVPGTNYTITIGSGGTSVSGTVGNSGNDSSFGALLVAGGGGGGGRGVGNGSIFVPTGSGGSGGGGGSIGVYGAAGGGGGAGGSGQTARLLYSSVVPDNQQLPGAQGNGIGSGGGSGVSQTSTSGYYAGGDGGPGLYGYGGGGGGSGSSSSTNSPAGAGSGGGGRGNDNFGAARSGEANTGGGGGGATGSNASGAGGSGYCYITWWE